MLQRTEIPIGASKNALLYTRAGLLYPLTEGPEASIFNLAPGEDKHAVIKIRISRIGSVTELASRVLPTLHIFIAGGIVGYRRNDVWCDRRLPGKHDRTGAGGRRARELQA